MNTFELFDREILEELEEGDEGVDAGFYVWLNDELIGYSQISHSNTEFDLTSTIQEGTNSLSVFVLI